MSVNGPALGQTETVVKSELAKFIKQHTGQDALSVIDEIVLSYVVGIVESLFIDGGGEDLFDVDQFSEMMAAYIPSFATINCQAVTQWMLTLSSSLDKKSKANGAPTFSSLLFKTQDTRDSPLILNQRNVAGSKRARSRSSSSQSDDERNPDSTQQLRVQSMKEQQQHPPKLALETPSGGLELLGEMFPHLSLEELQRALAIAAGDCQKAAQLLLLHKGELLLAEQQRGVARSYRNRTTSNSSSNNDLEEDFLQQDKQLREQILNKYAYIDQDDDVREHRPVAPKPEPKKLIRYRDNKIVSVKGERYSEVKFDDPNSSDKTQQLKLQRQYPRPH